MPEVGSCSSSWKSALPSVLLALFTGLGITALFCYYTPSLNVTNESTSSGSIISTRVGVKFIEKTTKHMTSGLGEYQEMTNELERQNEYSSHQGPCGKRFQLDERIEQEIEEFIKLETKGI